VLGTALQALSHDFPRSTYQLLTKVGRYGPNAADFDYSRDAVHRSVRRSLRRLHTQYLDVVYVHDIEFVASCVAPRAQGNHAAALGAEAAAYGLTEESCEPDVSGAPSGSGKGTQDNVRTAGDDERVLEAISALRELQAEGLIRHVGICGSSSFPHPTPTPLHLCPQTHRDSLVKTPI
jgi:aryl-alcohol dehydrogenase-like predicted oxidoreductase